MLDSFYLLKRSWYLLLTGVGIASLGYLLPKISFVTSFFSVGFTLAIPIFLIKIQEKQSVGVKDFLNIIWKITSRAFSAIVVLGSLLILIVFMFFFTGLYKFGSTNIQTFFINSNNLYGVSLGNFISSLVSSILLSLFVFTPIYFSLDGQSLYKALKSSAIFTLKNLQFTLSFLFLILIWSFVIKLLFYYSENIFGPVVFISLTQLGTLVSSILCLLYYQKLKG